MFTVMQIILTKTTDIFEDTFSGFQFWSFLISEFINNF